MRTLKIEPALHAPETLTMTGRLDETHREVTMATSDGEVVLRLRGGGMRHRVVRLDDLRDGAHYAMCEVEEDREGDDTSILVWSEFGGSCLPKWAVHISKRERVARVREMQTGRLEAVVDGRFRRTRKLMTGVDGTSVKFSAGVDVAIMGVFAGCLQDICDEAFGRNVPGAAAGSPRRLMRVV